MLDDAHAKLKPDQEPLNGASARAAGVVTALGLAAAVAAAVLLWSSEGAAVFLAQAFSALAACF